LDGKDTVAENLLATYKDVTYWTIEHSGAPTARNVGAKMATGDYIQFLDADMFLYPGSLRTFGEAFEDHPECGFVYGGYKITDKGFYPAQEFDPYFLYINNYIDGNFPMRKEVFEGWDKDCKSLQDWEMWVRMVKKGVKGHYLKDQYFFEKAAPPVGSISWDSHHNWIERKRYVQDKHKLPKRDFCLTSLYQLPNIPNHAKRVAKLLDYDHCDEFHLENKPHEYKGVLLIGWFPTQAVRNADIFMDMTVIPKRRRDIKKFIYWIGTDVWQMSILPIGYKFFKGLVAEMNKEYIQFCQPLVYEELKEMGLNVINMPLPIDVEQKAIPMPGKFTVAIYDHGQDIEANLYNYPIMEDIAKAVPDVNFVFFGDSRKKGDTELRNLKFLGYIPMDKIIAQSSVLLRITKHDGYPVTPVEFLNAGRVTITNQDMPYTIKAEIDLLRDKGIIDGKKDIIRKIRKLKKQYADKKFIEDGIEFYKKQLEPSKLKDKIRGYL
jgi:glycosyltransferase involved in cell wall biosynthesis